MMEQTKDLFCDYQWINPLHETNMMIYGFNWIKQDQIYRRLPLSSFEEIKKVCPLINDLADKTSGGQIHFVTDSDSIAIYAKIKGRAQLAGMTAVACGGFDCYVGKSYQDLKFYNTARFDINTNEYKTIVFENEPNLKYVVINFPVYGGVEHLEIGVKASSIIKKPEALDSKRIVIYGTSITQGACASRPGLTFTNILSRRLHKEFLNFGFSGNAFGEIELARLIASISDVSLFILDYEANGGTNGKLALTLEAFIQEIRKHHPKTPIAVLSRIKYLFDDIHAEMGKKRETIRAFQEDLVKRLKKNDPNIWYINGSLLLGKDYSEYTIDSIHPNDLGFMKIADGLEKAIVKIERGSL
ncbi:MAG: SGNH/GDSL hydrolase family protein [Bacilli bacterium]|jgi:lysophospholipase L1-like esterase|nr:SGNH/GDSL hydrolase family protein [Bacilli bacterium]